MGSTERREREREEMRRKILDAARELFARHGYDKVTMRGVAEAIEYSATAIYHHFEDKDALVRALCEEDFGRLLGAMRDRPVPADPVERIRELGRGYARFALSHPNHYRFLFMSPISEAQKAAVTGAAKGQAPAIPAGHPGEVSFDALHGAVADAVAAGRIRGVDALTGAQVLWATLHGAVSLLITLPGELWPHGPAAPDLVERVMENGLRGLIAGGAE